MTYAPVKFEAATSNGLGEDTITRNMVDAHTDRPTTDRLCYKINIPFFSKEKSWFKKFFILCNNKKDFMEKFCSKLVVYVGDFWGLKG